MALEVAVQNFLIVQVVDCKGLQSDNAYCLGDPVEYLGLTEILPLFLGGPDLGVHVARLAVDHHNADIAVLIGEGVLVADDVGVAEFLQQLQFIVNIISFLLFEIHYVQFLDDVMFALVLVRAQEHLPERSKLSMHPLPRSNQLPQLI